MERLAGLLAGTWLGVQITAGYIAAPLLFEHFNKMDAGNIAGSMFTVSAMLFLLFGCFESYCFNVAHPGGIVNRNFSSFSNFTYV